MAIPQNDEPGPLLPFTWPTEECDSALVADYQRAETHNPIVALARALHRQQHVRILLRSFSETLPAEWIEGYVLRFLGEASTPSRVVIASEPNPGADGAERIVRLDRVAMVQETVEPESETRITMPAPEPLPTRLETPPDADATLKIQTHPMPRRPSRG